MVQHTKTNMTDLGLLSLQLLLISFKCQRKRVLPGLLCLYVVSYLPSALAEARLAHIDVHGVRDSMASENAYFDPLLSVKGSYANAGDVKNAEGDLHMVCV